MNKMILKTFLAVTVLGNLGCLPVEVTDRVCSDNAPRANIDRLFGTYQITESAEGVEGTLTIKSLGEGLYEMTGYDAAKRRSEGVYRFKACMIGQDLAFDVVEASQGYRDGEEPRFETIKPPLGVVAFVADWVEQGSRVDVLALGGESQTSYRDFEKALKTSGLTLESGKTMPRVVNSSLDSTTKLIGLVRPYLSTWITLDTTAKEAQVHDIDRP